MEAVIALAHALDMRVVAEGVETEATAALLCELGCDYAQGYLFGRRYRQASLPASSPARAMTLGSRFRQRGGGETG